MIKVYINDSRAMVKQFVFPGGEVGVQIIPRDSHAANHVHVEALLKNSDDIMSLLMIKDALDRMVPWKAGRSLDLHYLPYARQDRVCNKGESLGVTVMASLINMMGFNHVVIHDPHSDVSPALIHNCTIEDQVVGLSDQFGSGDYDMIIAPDAGATKKAFKVAQFFNAKLIQAQKMRDVRTGNITSTYVSSIDLLSMRDKRVLVVDDICDGGMSFIKLAEEIKYKDVPFVLDLFITHGIFSKGKEVLKDYDNVYCKFDWEKL